ncbi:RtcB family protein [Flaviaesturariibacter flavus]|uniref:3'-phosphate/5'-hydroxy nucleic acid ligase n=1 Tax=Flaviaesturariibacter flavus TaxID=2502780 RepID=A0A4R1BAZ5_9BACT|nr:RtcB family protein [Flaviaesturariibacter flavus]TCJ14140.1 RtcB family protein [Flaviaesturariibacter flavus]
MAKLKLKGKDLRAIGYPESPVISLAMGLMEKHYRHSSAGEALKILGDVKERPADYLGHEVLGRIAEALLPKAEPEGAAVALNGTGVNFSIFGSEGIEQGALSQMNTAVRLPVAVAGALMPDAHSGYGLPIGGVLATRNAVIPYGVGVDIGCRMCLSVFDIDPKELGARPQQFAKAIQENTLFGSGGQFTRAEEHEVLESPLFSEIALLKGLHARAWKQLGTSGSGNHFVEFGVVSVAAFDPVLAVPAGNYLGLLSHSGSRALGANVANHFTKVAKDKRRLPPEAANLAWLDLDEQEGQEYWLAMNLAGDYASACHHVIHEKMAKALGRRPLRRVENHHNFAWKELWEGAEVIVHRKGATPAGAGVLGIIPGSMTAPGFIVKGKGEAASVNSAAHGAGRRMSRTAALQSISEAALREQLQREGVTLLGGGLDEAPMAYKDIHSVMKAQRALVDVVGTFQPRIVRMDGAPPKPWMKKKGDAVLGE